MPKFTAKNFIKFPNSLYFVTVFLILLLALVYLVYKTHQQLTISARQQYIGLVSANIISADQSMDELLDTLIVASTNYDKVVASAQIEGNINYNPIIQNNQQSLIQIELLKSNLDFQKDLLADTRTPGQYEDLRRNFDDYYKESSSLLEKLSKNFEVENNILIAFSQATNGIDITKKSLWQTANAEEISAYFNNLEYKTASSLEKLMLLQVPASYENYYNLHITYLEITIEACREIIAILNGQNLLENENTPNLLEFAVGSSTKTQNKLEALSRQIIAERDALFSSQHSDQDIKKLAETQSFLENEIKNLYQDLYTESNSSLELRF